MNGRFEEVRGYGALGRGTPNTNPDADDALAVTFYTDLESGKPHIRIQFPGDRTKEIDRPARKADQARFAWQWKAFEEGRSQLQGTPIESWPMVDARVALLLKTKAVLSVEQLAATPDSSLGELGLGARDLRSKAISWLAARKDNSDAVAKLAAEVKRLEGLVEKRA